MMMNDLVLSEDGHAMPADEYHDDEDWYENQTGDSISGYKPGYRPRRGNYTTCFILGGIVLALGGLAVAMLAKGEKQKLEGSTLEPIRDKGPTAAPKWGDGSMTYLPTQSPTSLETGVLNYLKQFVPVNKLLGDDDEYAALAFSWLMDNANVAKFTHHQLRQRLALASIYYATNEDESWVRTSEWLTDKDECLWGGVKCTNDGYIVGLNLTSNGLRGTFPEEITLLEKSLIALRLSDNALENQDEELKWMGELPKLRLLDVESTYMTYDGIPTYIGKLTDLRVLDVENTFFYGDLDGNIFKDLKDLIYLDIGDVWYNSTFPSTIAKLPKLEALYAYDCGLEGRLDSFFPHFGNQIFEMWFDDNNLSGSVPSEIGTMANLASLSLSDNALDGSIPSEVGALQNMEQMWIYGNFLTGDIPSEIGQMAKLQILQVEDNELNGAVVPSAVCAMNLNTLSADCNDGVTCSCCTCCEHPCPVGTISRIFDHNQRRLLL